MRRRNRSVSVHRSLGLLSGLLLLGGALHALAPALRGGQEESGPGGPQEGLVRVPAQGDAGSARDLDPTFDPNVWIDRLEARDLGEREAHFEALIRLARRDDRVRAFVQDLADETVDTELAWTARLLLRELREEPPRDLLFGWREVPDPFRPGDALRGFSILEPGTGMPDVDRIVERLLQGTGPPGARSTTESLRVEQTDEGWRIVLEEEVDGERTKREFTGESLDAILEANPDLKERVNGGGTGQRFHFEIGPGLFGGAPHVLRFGDPLGRDGEQRGFLLRSPTRPVRTDKLGVLVGPLGETEARRLGLEAGRGLLVQSAYPGTLAFILGVGSGDVLVELNGRELSSAADITEVLDQREADQPLVLTWIDATGARHTRTWDPTEETPAEPRDF